MLNTTQNTRELGGYQTVYGVPTRERTVIRSDVQNYPDEEDCLFLKSNGITTIIDMRGTNDVLKKPSGFCGREGFTYYNFPIDEGSGIPASVDEVPKSYMRIASAKSVSDVFLCVANADSGVMINCTAGKDRTGVVSAILLLHAGVSDRDITENYVLTKEYGKERLELIHKNFPEIDMRIVTPCEMYMEEFLRLFRDEYGNTEAYFRKIGLCDEDILKLRRKLLGK